jgi:hypothetical protein
MEPLMTDEIIDEIHAVRREHAASFDFDIKLIIADLRRSERIHTEQGWPLVQVREGPAPGMASTRIRFAQR